jgi:proteasome lid subunit RPN8/RPN11
MKKLVIRPRHLHTIHQHAAMTYPEECCGILIGHRVEDNGESTAIVERILSANNDREEESRHNRYVIDPQTVLAAHKEARAAGADVVGYYHSHPDCAAVPSDFDREHAWPGLTYLIVSVEEGTVVDSRGWQLTDDRREFEEETLDPAPLGTGAPVAKNRRAS